jgi:hypothetical protein
MSDVRVEYLNQCRLLVSKRSAVEAGIASLSIVCQTLKDWRKLASDLIEQIAPMPHTGWTDKQLSGITGLRTSLIEYQQVFKTLESNWASMNNDDRFGLRDPNEVSNRPV